MMAYFNGRKTGEKLKMKFTDGKGMRGKAILAKEKIIATASFAQFVLLCLFLSAKGNYYNTVLAVFGQESAQIYSEFKEWILHNIGYRFWDLVYAYACYAGLVSCFNLGKIAFAFCTKTSVTIAKDEYEILNFDYDCDDNEDLCEAELGTESVFDTVLALRI